MARMLTEEEVWNMEKQRELQDRARAAGNATAGMSWNERKRFEEAQERQMWDQRFRETHGGLSRAEVAAAGPNGSGRQYAAIKRGFELQAARQNEMERLGKELATREKEAHERRMGMREQGWKAAEMNKDAAIRAAELQRAGAEKVASINTASAEKIAGIKAASEERIEKDKGEVAKEVAGIGADSTVEVEREKASAQARTEYAQRLMRQRTVDEETAWKHASDVEAKAMQMVRQSKGRITLEEARKKVLSGMREPGKKRNMGSWEY